MVSVRSFFPVALTLLFAGTLLAQNENSRADRQRQLQQLQEQRKALPQRAPQTPHQQGQPGAVQKSAPNQARQQNTATTPLAPSQVKGTQAKPGEAKVPRAPVQLTDAEQQRLDRLLTYWESRSGKVKTYSCEFTRLEYDSVFGPKNPKWPRTKSEGLIRFSSPDKGEFRVVKIGHFQPPTAEGQPPTWPMNKKEEAEHWICNGQSVFELNAKKKQLIERKLAPEMQGNQIADGPLPFMFGAKKDKLVQRYWIQELTPPANRKGEYWLEAYPRLAETAAEFQRVRVILDEKTFLPNALEVYPPQFNGKNNTSRTVYMFEKRRVNDPLHRGQQFLGRFISPKTPRGWKKIIENFNDPPRPSVADASGMGEAPSGQAVPQKR